MQTNNEEESEVFVDETILTFAELPYIEDWIETCKDWQETEWTLIQRV
jgi:hypothetical protein